MPQKTVLEPETDEIVEAPVSDELDGIEELPDDGEEITDETPAAKTKGKGSKAKTQKKPAAEKPAFGANELAEHVSEAVGKQLDAKNIRAILRTLAANPESPVTAPEGRYSFTGPKDPQVIAVVEYVRSGQAQKAKAESLAKLKKAKAEEAAANEPVAEAEGTDSDAPVEDLEDLEEL